MKIDIYARKRYKDNERFIMQYKELWGNYLKNDEIKWSIDTLDKNDVDILSNIITDFDIIGNIRLHSDFWEPEGKFHINY